MFFYFCKISINKMHSLSSNRSLFTKDKSDTQMAICIAQYVYIKFKRGHDFKTFSCVPKEGFRQLIVIITAKIRITVKNHCYFKVEIAV